MTSIFIKEQHPARAKHNAGLGPKASDLGLRCLGHARRLPAFAIAFARSSYRSRRDKQPDLSTAKCGSIFAGCKGRSDRIRHRDPAGRRERASKDVARSTTVALRRPHCAQVFCALVVTDIHIFMQTDAKNPPIGGFAFFVQGIFFGSFPSIVRA